MKTLESKTLYVCGVAWDTELGHTQVDFYESIEELKANRNCYENCGIVKVTAIGEWVEPQRTWNEKERTK